MEPEAKSRTDAASPQPAATQRLSDEEKRALELNDEAEHAHGEQREEAIKKAGALGTKAQQ